MNRRLTWWLVALAAVLFAFILFVERHIEPTTPESLVPDRLVSFRAFEVTNVSIRVTNRLMLKAEKINNQWMLTVPLTYPAQSAKVEGLLQVLETLESSKRITLAEVSAHKQTVAEFGLDIPRVSVALQHNGQRTELLLGSPTAAADHVYMQLLASADIHEVKAELLNRLPRDANEWRAIELLPTGGLLTDRMEVRAPGRGYAVVLEPTNRLYRFTKPMPARADRSKVEAVQLKIAASTIARFEFDGAVADLEPYGLQPPAAELVFGQGTNDVFVLQFGKVSPADTNLVFARRLGRDSIFLVAKSLLDLLLAPYTELRDRHLLSFDAPEVSALEVIGPERYEVQRQTNGQWMVTGGPAFAVDRGLVADCLDRLSRLEGAVEKEVVTDYATTYGLAQPKWSFQLKTASTNSTGALTNRMVAQIDLGLEQNGRVFVRRPDETAVYSLPVDQLGGLPFEAWQLRDRRVYRFTTNQVAGVTIRQNGYERKFIRDLQGLWTLAPGSQGVLNTLAVEEMLFRLGELRALAWVERGVIDRARYGFTDDGYRLTIELRNGEKPAVHTLEFGQRTTTLAPFAMTTLDGQAWVFEFPAALFYELLKYLTNPPVPKSVPRPSL